MKQINSGTIISHAVARSKTGTPHGEHGLATQSDTKVAKWLAAHTPDQVEKALVSRASSRGVKLDLIYDHRFPRDERGRSLPVISTCKGVTVRGDADQIEAVRADFEKAMEPATPQMIEAWLAELSVVTAKRNDDAFSETLRIRAYVERLSNYPADIVREVLLGRSYRFFPSWADLHPALELATQPRRMAIASLSGRGHEEQPQRERCSPERAAEIMRDVFGDE